MSPRRIWALPIILLGLTRCTTDPADTSLAEPNDASAHTSRAFIWIPRPRATGLPCDEDDDCASHECWDYSHVDPKCGGKMCSDSCSTNADCERLASSAGVSNASRARCGGDHRCDLSAFAADFGAMLYCFTEPSP